MCARGQIGSVRRGVLVDKGLIRRSAGNKYRRTDLCREHEPALAEVHPAGDPREPQIALERPMQAVQVRVEEEMHLLVGPTHDRAPHKGADGALGLLVFGVR